MSDTAQVIFGICFIFLMTSLGSGLVFLFKNKIGDKTNKLLVGFSSGIMIAASVWSLLIPAIDQSESYGNLQFLPAVIGFLVGGIFLLAIDLICKFIDKKANKNDDFAPSGLKKSSKIFIAMTLHNIPEGLAVGVAFGGAWASGSSTAISLALSIAIAVGIQNFPEGAAISIPMKLATGSKAKGFWLGVLSGVAEPIAAVIGFYLASTVTAIMPWVLSFAAGSMIYVVVNELMPELSTGEGSALGTWGTMIGFMLMMALDVGLG